MNDMTPESLYEEGMRVKKDSPNRSAEYFEKASKDGYVKATRELGLMYLNGLGLEKDLSKAYDLLSEASGQMDPEAVYSLALMYERGLGVEADLHEALRLYAFSANMNLPEAETDADRVEELIKSERTKRLRSRPILNLEISEVDIEAACCKEMFDAALEGSVYVVETYQGPELVGDDEFGFEIIHAKCPFCGKKAKRVSRDKIY